MIDTSKCVFEESCETPAYNEVTYYFTYPKEMDIVEFYSEEDYGNVVSMCIALTEVEGVEYTMSISPTVLDDEDGNEMLSDVDWHNLYYGYHYDDDTVLRLLKIAWK